MKTMPPESSSKQFMRELRVKFSSYSVILLLSLIVFLLLLYVNHYFRLRVVQVSGDNGEQNLIGLESLKGSNLLWLNPESVRKIINQHNPDYTIRDVSKIYPDKIVIKIIREQPVGALKLNIGYAELSSAGKVIKKTKTGSDAEESARLNLPVINFYQQLDYYQVNLGNYLDYEGLLMTLYLLIKCRELELKINYIDINSLNMIVFNLKDREESRLLFSAEKDRDLQAYELETLIRQFKIEGQDFKVIGLRYNKPIVKF